MEKDNFVYSGHENLVAMQHALNYNRFLNSQLLKSWDCRQKVLDKTGLVLKIPTIMVAIGLFISSLLSLFLGIVQNSIIYTRGEFKRLLYLSIPFNK